MAESSDSRFSQNLKFPDWQIPLFAALKETDPLKLKERVFTLEEAINLRKQSLAGSPNADAEKQALDEAIQTLRTIQVEKLNYPDWRK